MGADFPSAVKCFLLLFLFGAWCPVQAFRLSANFSSAVQSIDRHHQKLQRTTDDLLDLSPLFHQGLVGPNETKPKVFLHEERRLRCCCNDGKCTVADLKAKNKCDTGISLRSRETCPCLVGSGYGSFHRAENGGTCLVPTPKATEVFKMSEEQLKQTVAEAAATRYVDGWRITYGKCSTSCGPGLRLKISAVCTSKGECEPPVWVEESIPCTETSACEWKCSHSSVRPCGFGTVTCLDGKRGPGNACHIKGEREANFPDTLTFAKSCFLQCEQGQELSSVCAITSNHLDEQYGSVASLVAKTCLSDTQGHPTLQKPQMIVLLTQELNHASWAGLMDSNDFPSYVSPEALPGYVRAATCEGDLSANTAVYVRVDQQHHVFADDSECSKTALRSDPCDYTNCKGSTVMGLSTSAGKLVLGNWHGARAGTLSETRVKEFESAAKAVLDMQSSDGRKLVIWGGDINVRSNFGPEGSKPLDLEVEQTPAQIRAGTGPDILGMEGWTVDQHLSGEVGTDQEVMTGLRKTPLKQVKGWDTICPTKTKAKVDARYKDKKVWGGAYKESWMGIKRKVYKTVKERLPNIRCRSPADQMSTGDSPDEFLDMKMPWGDHSKAPSYTERFFLSQMMYDSCGKAMKDIRNARDDHDAFYVRCVLPPTTL